MMAMFLLEMSARKISALVQMAQVQPVKTANRMGRRCAPLATVASHWLGSRVWKTYANAPVARERPGRIVQHTVHPNACHAILVSLWKAIRVWRTNAIVVMAQPQPAMIARAMESTNAPRATRVSKMQGKSALSAMRTLVEHAGFSIATVGVMPRVSLLNASALPELAMSTENAKHLLTVKKP